MLRMVNLNLKKKEKKRLSLTRTLSPILEQGPNITAWTSRTKSFGRGFPISSRH